MIPVATVIAITDRGDWQSPTDVLVVVDPECRRLLWVPRDLWCESLGRRINAAFRVGGHGALMGALREHDIAVEHAVCLRREATERALRDVTVRVHVCTPMSFWYPLAPCEPIEEGRKRIAFDPPAELLSGERIHQWLGARFEISRPLGWRERVEGRLRRIAWRWIGRSHRPRGMLPDLDRIERQQAFVRELLVRGFDFSLTVSNPEWVSLSDPHALDELAQVTPRWRTQTFDDVKPRTIRRMNVLVRRVRRTRPFV